MSRALICLLLLGGVAHADPPLRMRVPLIARLGDATFDPPLTKRDLGEPCKVGSSYENPYSPLPKPMRRRHQRVTLSAGKAIVELRDTFMLDVPRRVTLELDAPDNARLELGYRVAKCKDDAHAKLTLVITTEDAQGTLTRRVPLDTRRPPRDDPWRELALDLPLEPGPARLTLSFETDAEPGALMVVMAEPALTGVDLDAPDDASTNLLWVVIDATRSDTLGAQRTFEMPVPSLDREFHDGTQLAWAYSMGNQTRTSTTAMLSGIHPAIGGFYSHDWAFAEGRLQTFYDSRPPLVTAILEQAGWRVAHFGHNFFLWGDDPVGIDAGFPEILDFRSIPEDAINASDYAVRFFEEHRDERWALMLNYTAPHTPYEPPDEWAQAANDLPGPERLGAALLPRSYLGEIMWVDHNFARVVAALDRLDLTKKTLVIITADHGEVMLPWHDCRGTGGERCGFNHSWTLYDDETHVPLTFALPGRVEQQVIDTPVSHADLAPTILDMLGQPPAPGMAGHSLRAALEGRALTPTPIYSDGRRAAALRSGDWKLILHAPDDTIEPPARRTAEELTPKLELFDLAHDPGERQNLVLSHHDVVTRLLAELKEVRNTFALRFTTRPVDRTTTSTASVTPAASDRADNRLLNTCAPADLAVPVTGTIRAVDGLIRCGATPAGSRCEAAGDTLTVSLAANATLAFETRPWAAALDVRLTRRAPIPVDRLRLGEWGLALLHPGERLDTREHLELATNARMTAPIVQPRESALYLWRSAAEPLVAGPMIMRPVTPSSAPGAFVAPEDQVGDPRADERLGSELRKALKDLGYTH